VLNRAMRLRSLEQSECELIRTTPMDLRARSIVRMPHLLALIRMTQLILILAMTRVVRKKELTQTRQAACSLLTADSKDFIL